MPNSIVDNRYLKKVGINKFSLRIQIPQSFMISINQANYNKLNINLKASTFKMNIISNNLCVVVPTYIKLLDIFVNYKPIRRFQIHIFVSFFYLFVLLLSFRIYNPYLCKLKQKPKFRARLKI